MAVSSLSAPAASVCVFFVKISLSAVSLSPVLVMMKSKELKTKIYSHAHSLILSLQSMAAAIV